MRRRGRNAVRERLAAEQDHVIDTVSLDGAFFGEHDQSAKLVLILREHADGLRRSLSGRKQAKTSGARSPLQKWSDEWDYRDSYSCQIKNHTFWI